MKHVLAHRLLFNEKIIPGSGIYKRIFDRDKWYIYRGIVKVADANGKRTKRGICRRTRWEHNVPYFPLYEALVGSEPVMDLPRYEPYG